MKMSTFIGEKRAGAGLQGADSKAWAMKPGTNLFQRLLPSLFLAGLVFIVFQTAGPVYGSSKPVSVSIKKVTSWTEGAYTFTQYSLKLTGKQSAAVTDWKVKATFDRSVKVTNSWNGTFSGSGKSRVIKPADYNKTIERKQTVEAGFILRSKGKVDVKTLKVTTWTGKKSNTFTKTVGTAKKTASPTPTPTATPTPSPAAAKTTASKTPLAANGRLKVKGTRLVNSKGKSIILKGVSTHGLGWYPQYVNKSAFKTLRDQWGVNCIRLAMYTAEYNGYCTGGDQEELKALVDKGVKYAKSLGMYVIIDWHILSDSDPRTNQKQAVAFFREMSKKYKNYKNVIYEICNEPNGSTSWSQIKSYAGNVIKTIRANDKNNIILVGTPTWSQDVDTAAKSPIKGYKNIMYTFHFYAGTHGGHYRSKVQAAIDAGLPVFVSEFGITDASGNGAVNKTEGNKWIRFLKKNGISFVCWNLSNKNESSALLKSSCTRTGGFKKSDLSAQGKWYKAVS